MKRLTSTPNLYDSLLLTIVKTSTDRFASEVQRNESRFINETFSCLIYSISSDLCVWVRGCKHFFSWNLK